MKRAIVACLCLGLFVFASPRFSASQDTDVIKLPAPQMTGGKPLMDCLKARQSTRGNFGPEEKLSMQTLSNLLWAADGVNRPAAPPTRPTPMRTAPDAAGWHNLQIYVLTADGVFRATGGYAIFHSDLLRRSTWIFGVGALFAAMSLAAMPPQAGFVTEWFVFQTVFQGFHLGTLGGRMAMALAGAGLALTAAVSFATFVKVFGVGLLGRSARTVAPVSTVSAAVIGLLGLSVLAFAVGMPLWLEGLRVAVAGQFGTSAASEMHDGPLLVPLTAKFAFISPTLLVVVMPLLAIIPLVLLVASRKYYVRRAPVWYGGLDHDPERASTTALTFSNAMRTFYSFVYRPREQSEVHGPRYFVHRLTFTHDVAPIFGPYLFSPIRLTVYFLADKVTALQSGHLNFYLALIGGLLVIILALTLT